MTRTQEGATAAIKAVNHTSAKQRELYGPTSIAIKVDRGRNGPKFPRPIEDPKACLAVIASAVEAAKKARLPISGVYHRTAEVPTDPTKLLAFVKKQVKAGDTLWAGKFSLQIGDPAYYPGTRAKASAPRVVASDAVDVSDIADLLD